MLALALLACAPPPAHDTLPLAAEVAAVGVESWPPASLYPGWVQTVIL